MVLYRTVLFIFISFLSFDAFPQKNSFGLEFGRTFQNDFGAHQLDSVVVIPSSNEPFDSRVIGGFFELSLSNRFSLHSKLNFTKSAVFYLMYNSVKECLFCPIRKVPSLGINRLSFEILPQFSLIRLNKFQLNVFGGVNTTVNFVVDRPEVKHRDAQAVAVVVNSLNSAPIPVTMSYVYGTSLEYYERIVLWARWTANSLYSRDIAIQGENYKFENRWKFFTISVGYKFYSFKVNKRKQLDKQ